MKKEELYDRMIQFLVLMIVTLVLNFIAHNQIFLNFLLVAMTASLWDFKGLIPYGLLAPVINDALMHRASMMTAAATIGLIIAVIILILFHRFMMSRVSKKGKWYGLWFISLLLASILGQAGRVVALNSLSGFSATNLTSALSQSMSLDFFIQIIIEVLVLLVMKWLIVRHNQKKEKS